MYKYINTSILLILVFPHCQSDSRKNGHVIASISAENFELQACKEDGTLESQIIPFAWSKIIQWDVDDEGMAFAFQYERPDKAPRWVKIFTTYVRMSKLHKK